MAKFKEPAKTVKAYKLFRVDQRQPGKLFPLFVHANQPVDLDTWHEAQIGEMTGDKVKSKIGPLAFRPGWHAGDLPVATHIGENSDPVNRPNMPPDTRPSNHVWAEVEMPDDVDWQSVANERGTNAKGRVVPVKAHITDQIPKGGHYRYKTNSNMTGNWLIGGAMKVNKVLSDKEVRAINKAAGVADLPRAAPFPAKKYGFAKGGSASMLIIPDYLKNEELANYRDPKTTKIADWKWRKMQDVRKDVPISEIPDYIQKGYGEFMKEQRGRAQAGQLSPRDLLKAFTITQSSIGRGGLSHATATKTGMKLPNTGGEVRPEGAFAEWLGSPMGQKYLNAAEQGLIDPAALSDIQQKFSPFGKHNQLIDQMAYAAHTIPGMAKGMNQAVTGSTDDYRDWAEKMKGIAGAKSGFVGSMLGRGDLPTLDARQLNLHTLPAKVGVGSIMSRGKGTGAREAVDRLAARQHAMKLKIDPSMAPHYQHLAHHAVWDAMGNNQTTHDDLMKAMRGYADGGSAWKPHPENDLLQPIGSSKMVGDEKLVSDDGDFKSGLSMFPSNKKSYRYVYHGEDQTPIGAMQIATQGPRSKKAVIQNLYVAEANRRQGIASKLLDRARQDFDVKHSDDLTTAGKAFAKAKKAHGGRVTHAHHLDIEERPL